EGRQLHLLRDTVKQSLKDGRSPKKISALLDQMQTCIVDSPQGKEPKLYYDALFKNEIPLLLCKNGNIEKARELVTQALCVLRQEYPQTRDAVAQTSLTSSSDSDAESSSESSSFADKVVEYQIIPLLCRMGDIDWAKALHEEIPADYYTVSHD